MILLRFVFLNLVKIMHLLIFCLVLCSFDCVRAGDNKLVVQKFRVYSNDNDPDNYDTEEIILTNDQLISDLKKNSHGLDKEEVILSAVIN